MRRAIETMIFAPLWLTLQALGILDDLYRAAEDDVWTVEL